MTEMMFETTDGKTVDIKLNRIAFIHDDNGEFAVQMMTPRHGGVAVIHTNLKRPPSSPDGSFLDPKIEKYVI
jgi:hypothetical protein